MKGISSDIEIAVSEVIKGLEYDIDVVELDDNNIKSAMESKMIAFSVAKDLITKWRNSPNAPTDAKLKDYIRKLVVAADNAIENLRTALSKQIDYSVLDATKIKTAIQAKPVIYKALYDISSGVFELRAQLESGKINTEDDEFRIGFPEKFANGEMLDTSGYFKNWHNQRYDAVKICPFGSEGDIIEIDGLNIQLPKVPKDKTKILFHDKKKEDQYWQIQPPPVGLTRETQEQYVEYIFEEYRRRVEGIWFYNNGEPTYLTGDMYFALNYCKMMDDGIYMSFRKGQLKIMYFLQACIVDPRCLGDLFEKSRRTGYTFLVLFIILNRITMTKNQKAGITSKTDKDSEEAFIKLSYTFLNLPVFFKPVVRGGIESRKKLEFSKPPENSKEAKKNSKNDTEKYLNSVIDYRSSAEGSYDSIQLNWYLCDEASKRHPASIAKHLGQVTPTMKKGGRIVGKAFVGSTVAAAKEGGAEFKGIAESSDLKLRNAMTRETPSKLYRHALYAHENYEKTTDKYGVCYDKRPTELTINERGEVIEYGATELIMSEADSLRKESDELYNEFLRANPLSRNDMYRDASSGSDFNVLKINEQHIYNRDLDRRFVERGNFHWKDGTFDTEVVWTKDEKHGKFYATWFPEVKNRNKTASIEGIKYPKNGHIGRGGVDSYNKDQTVDKRSSNGSLHLYNIYNTQENTPKYQFVLEYIERPPYAEIFFEDVLMAAVFYGYPLLIENNKEAVIDYIRKRGYGGYVMRRPKEYTPESNLKRKVVEWGIPSNSDDIIIKHSGKIERYIHYHVGAWTQENEDEENIYGRSGYRPVGATGSMLFERTLSDWSLFDIKKRTKYDATISSGYALMAADVKFRSFEEDEQQPKYDGMTLAKRYKYVNGKPVRI